MGIEEEYTVEPIGKNPLLERIDFLTIEEQLDMLFTLELTDIKEVLMSAEENHELISAFIQDERIVSLKTFNMFQIIYCPNMPKDLVDLACQQILKTGTLYDFLYIENQDPENPLTEDAVKKAQVPARKKRLEMLIERPDVLRTNQSTPKEVLRIAKNNGIDLNIRKQLINGAIWKEKGYIDIILNDPSIDIKIGEGIVEEIHANIDHFKNEDNLFISISNNNMLKILMNEEVQEETKEKLIDCVESNEFNLYCAVNYPKVPDKPKYRAKSKLTSNKERLGFMERLTGLKQLL